MVKGDAFSRSEVSSRYVHRDDRYVFSFIVGFKKDQVDSAPSAAAAAIEMVCGEGSAAVRVFVHDRDTGEVLDVSKEEILKMLGAGSGS